MPSVAIISARQPCRSLGAAIQDRRPALRGLPHHQDLRQTRSLLFAFPPFCKARAGTGW